MATEELLTIVAGAAANGGTTQCQCPLHKPIPPNVMTAPTIQVTVNHESGEIHLDSCPAKDSFGKKGQPCQCGHLSMVLRNGGCPFTGGKLQ